jgi:hypothetical protein
MISGPERIRFYHTGFVCWLPSEGAFLFLVAVTGISYLGSIEERTDRGRMGGRRIGSATQILQRVGKSHQVK